MTKYKLSMLNRWSMRVYYLPAVLVGLLTLVAIPFLFLLALFFPAVFAPVAYSLRSYFARMSTKIDRALHRLSKGKTK